MSPLDPGSASPPRHRSLLRQLGSGILLGVVLYVISLLVELYV